MLLNDWLYLSAVRGKDNQPHAVLVSPQRAASHRLPGLQGNVRGSAWTHQNMPAYMTKYCAFVAHDRRVRVTCLSACAAFISVAVCFRSLSICLCLVIWRGYEGERVAIGEARAG